LETERLVLRPMKAEDIDAMLDVFTSFTEPRFTRSQMLQWVHRNLDHQARHGYGLFAVILKGEGLLIGDCGLEWMEVDGVPVAELGYDLARSYWNQGYATEAATAVRDYTLRSLGLPDIVSLIQVGNLASRRVAEKLGMRLLDEIVRYSRPYWKYGIG